VNDSLKNDETLEALKKSTKGQPLPFNEKMQSCFIGHLFDPTSRLFKQAYGIMDKHWFSSPVHQKIWELFQFEYERADPKGELPSLEMVKDSLGLARTDEKMMNTVRLTVDIAWQDRKLYTAAFIKLQIEDWLHAKVLQDTIERGTSLFNTGKFSDAQEILDRSQKQFSRSRILLHDEDPTNFIDHIAAGMGPKNVVPFGLHEMDNFLFPNNPLGSLCKGDQTVLMAPINCGKTTTMTTVCVHNARAQLNVLLMIHEGNQYALRLKIVRAFMTLMDLVQLQRIFPDWAPERLPPIQIFCQQLAAKETANIIETFVKMKGQPGGIILNTIAEYIFKYIKFIPHIQPGTNVQDLLPIIERAQDGCKDKNGGKGFDLFVCDYPGILNVKNANKNYQHRQIKQEVYEWYAQLAGQHEWHSLVAIQTNREGSKINSGIGRNGQRSQHAERLLGNEDVSETWGALMGAATVITINRSPEDQQENRVTYSISKSRTSEVHYNVTCFSNFKQGVSHSDGFTDIFGKKVYGCLSWYGVTASKKVIDQYLKPGEGHVITHAELLAAKDKEEKTGEDIMLDQDGKPLTKMKSKS
jgi:hypothetical protein